MASVGNISGKMRGGKEKIRKPFQNREIKKKIIRKNKTMNSVKLSCDGQVILCNKLGQEGEVPSCF